MVGKELGAGFTKRLESLANECICHSVSREESLMGWGRIEGPEG